MAQQLPTTTTKTYYAKPLQSAKDLGEGSAQRAMCGSGDEGVKPKHRRQRKRNVTQMAVPIKGRMCQESSCCNDTITRMCVAFYYDIVHFVQCGTIYNNILCSVQEYIV